jgi:DNA invertase Pin-like site-specific DNA recombinase
MAPDVVSFIEAEMRKRGIEPSVCRAVSAAARAEYGGGQTYVRRVDHEGRNQRIEELLDRGASPRAIAKVTGLSASTIRRKRSNWL